MNATTNGIGRGLMHLTIGIAVLLATGLQCFASVTVPEGTVIALKIQDSLSSASSNVGDTFRATIARSVYANGGGGGVAIPIDSRVDGRVTVVRPAELGVRSGVIGVEFYRLTLPDGASYAIEGALTSLRPDQAPRPVRQNFNSTNKDFIIGGTNNPLIGVLSTGAMDRSSLLSSGTEAEVAAGTEVNMQVLRAFTLGSSASASSGSSDGSVYTSASMIRGAQATLKDRSYYRGVVNGVYTQGTRLAIESFQTDNGLPVTGQLDQATASALGLVQVGDRPVVNSRVSNTVYRDAQSLLSGYESALGVQVGDIRSGITSSRLLTEGDLELLLDVDSFNKAAYWYEQATRNALNSDAASVAARILSRTASRIDADLPAARPDRQFSQRWSTVQADLSNLGNRNMASANGTVYQDASTNSTGRVYQDGSTNSTSTNNDGSNATTGHFRWQGIVDGLDNISLRGSTVSISHLQSAPIQEAHYDLSVPLPRRPVNLTLNKVRGRGNIALLEQPSADNNYTAVVQVDDQAMAGSDWYEFTLDW